VLIAAHSDYADVAAPEAESVRELRAETVAFVAACERVVERLIAGDSNGS
jgi:hypothetical protein